MTKISAGNSSHDASWMVFILPFAIILFIVGGVWLLSTSQTIQTGYKGRGEPQYVRGIVLKSITSSDPLSGQGYLQVLDENNSVEIVYFENAASYCKADTALKQGSSAKPGDRVVAYGLSVAPGTFEICSSPYFYLNDSGPASVYESWEAFRNPSVGLQFQYPQNWVLSTSTGAASAQNISLAPASTTGSVIDISFFPGTSDFALSEWASQYYGVATTTPLAAQIGGSSGIVFPVTEGKVAKNILLLKRGDTIIQFEFPDPATVDTTLAAIPALVMKSISFDAPQAAAPKSGVDAGISGSVLLGPSCPVAKNPPDPACADKPYPAKLRILDAKGAIAARVTAAANGTFKVALLPGAYAIENDAASSLPRLAPLSVTVLPHQFVPVAIVFDSGIR